MASKEPNDRKGSTRQPSQSSTSLVSIVLKLVVAVLLVTKLHWHGPILAPRCQVVVYPAEQGQDVTYGVRVVFDDPDSATKWQFELGKVVDDGLRSRINSAYVGFADNWFYFKLDGPDQSHILLASLFKADMISRTDAEALLNKGVAKETSAAPFVHRLPSLSTLAAAYYAGATLGTRVILGRMTVDSKVMPIVVGGATVCGASVVFSRTSLGTKPQGGMQNATASGFDVLSFACKPPQLVAPGVAVDLGQVQVVAVGDFSISSAAFGMSDEVQRSANTQLDIFDQAVEAFEQAQRSQAR
ncbi:hypothetical protein OIO90_003731 [Microbotryomycetes sp. JL221]|nr:hypothetical protein OIO90_003731 [Microbotryomycetes sp. JL221]